MERFVVGTGRCGSTLLSLMLAQHTQVVTIHEFFSGLDWVGRFRSGDVPATDVVKLISAPQFVATAVLARGHSPDEVQYPIDRSGMRYKRGDEIPWLLVAMLPRLTADPDALFDELVAYAATLPTQPLAAHYLRLFEWVAARFGRPVWVERGGGALEFLADLVSLYPNAKFLHIHRDGHETALSLRAHPFFRMGIALILGLYRTNLDPETAATFAIDNPPPLWAAGRFWADQVLHGFRALQQLDRDQYLEARFEDIINEPANALERIARFFELPADDGFITRAAKLVRGMPPRRFPLLSPPEKEELKTACRPGQVLLGRES
jgi:hypothetical protein